MTAPNRFFIWEAARPVPTEFTPADRRNSLPPTDVRYFSGILDEADRLLGPRGQTFLLTWNLDHFDPMFADSIVMLVGDERYQVPGYASRVKAVFKTGGARPNPLRHLTALPLSLSSRVALRGLRNFAVAAKRRIARRQFGSNPTPTFDIPLGYLSLVDVPFKPWHERTIDVFFAGAMPTKQGLELRPSTTARVQMSQAVEVLKSEHPELNIDCSVGTGHARRLTPEEYSSRLMDAKVALCPRGNFDETFRLFEAAKSGCVVVPELLPPRWYHEALPAVEITDWRTLSATIGRCFSDRESLAQRAAATHEWWKTRACEAAVGAYVAGQVRNL
jgi:hypothetical protein